MLHDFNELEARLGELEPGRLSVGFFIGNPVISQDEWMNPLAAALNDMGFFTVGLTIKENLGKCSLDAMHMAAVLKPEELMRLERINAFLISDMDTAYSYPLNSKVMGCVHAFDSTHDTAFQNQINLLLGLDGLLVPFPINEVSRKATKDMWTGFASREACKRQGDAFSFIPAGYPRMTVLVNELAKSRQVPDSILYAPMISTFVREQGGERIKKHGKSLIRTLLAKFPAMNVIFRPYKSDLNTPLVNSICESFAAEPRFKLDDSPGRLNAFARSACLVTDLSHIAKTFAYATARPAIYYRPWTKRRQEIAQIDIGYQVATIGSLVESIKDCLHNPQAHSKRLLALRNSTAMPFENSFEEIGACLKDFCAGRTRPDWLTIDKFGKQYSDVEMAGRIMGKYSSLATVIATSAAVLHYPISPLLMAYALHKCRVEIPLTRIFFGLGKMTSEYLASDTVPIYYKDVKPETIKLLYSMALRDKLRSHDEKGITLIEGLLKNLQEQFPETAHA